MCQKNKTILFFPLGFIGGKKWLFSKSLSTFFLVQLLIFSFSFCGSGTLNNSNNNLSSPWFKYVVACTSGIVSKNIKIQVLFTNSAINSNSSFRQQPESLLDFTPHIKGTIKWENPKRLSFIPSQPLLPGTQYTGVLHLNKMVKMPEGMTDYYFKFTVISPDFEVKTDGLSFANENDRSIEQLNGAMISADFEDNSSVEKILTAYQDKQSLPITWYHSENGKHHRFTVKSIHRKKSQSQVLLKWNGTSIGVPRQGERSYSIAPLGEFKVLEVQAFQEDQQYIGIRFSDPLDKNQNLDGLIWMEDQQVRLSVEGNLVKVYPASVLHGESKINVESGIKDEFTNPLKQSSSYTVTFQNIPPQVRFVGKGEILPENDRLTVPFEAINLHSIQVTAFQVYADNMGQFLQTNSLDGKEELKRVGRYLWRKDIKLSQNRAVTGKWSRFNIDVTSLFKENPGSLFRLELSFNRSNSAYPCANSTTITTPQKELPLKNCEDFQKEEYSNWDGYENYYNYNSTDDDWQYRNDPCYDAYYNPYYNGDKIRCARNFIASNIGLVAKMGESPFLYIVVSDLRTALPLKNTKIEVFNFQNQVIGHAISDEFGLAQAKLSGTPFYISAYSGNDRGYLKVNANTCLPLSHFDVGGESVRMGIKGFIYGERGVWRPGDTVYLTFLLQDKTKILPVNHPVTMEIYNSKGQMVKTLSPEKSLNNFHTFKIVTEESALTGNWRARVLVGGLVFDHAFKVETVVPNRLKIEMDFGKERLVVGEMPVTAQLFSQWLHGAAASNLKTSVNVRLSSLTTHFSRFQDYIFDDVTRTFSGSEEEVFKGQLDETGRVSFDIDLKTDKNTPGLLNASFESRVFEDGGDFSTDRFSVPFHPYNSYVGIKAPKGDESRGMLLTDKVHTVRIASLNPQGTPVSREKVEVSLYKIKWKWWWDKSGETFGQFNSASGITPLSTGVISTKDGEGQWNFEIHYPQWGRYLIRARDLESGHCSSKVIYIDWPGWAGRAREEKGPGATRLNFTSDKTHYSVGETAVIYLPESLQGRALVSLENGSDVLEQRWVNTKPGENRFNLEITSKMSPNIYVHVTLLQPHANKENDNPIRLYGVIPLFVDDPGSHLHPVIKTTDEFRPKEDVRINISEKNGLPMTYTLAVVDEGLLGLTRFQTPNPRSEFYKRESLGVKTWDLFDDVVGAYGGELERILAIGGDGNIAQEKAKKKRRFPPVVLFTGPFYLEPGGSASHDLKLPQYIGAVRVMVVAGSDNAYGCAEKSVPVKHDLMVLSTFPRALRPMEEFDVPVSVFVMNPSIGKVQIKINTGDIFESPSENIRTVTFTKPGDEIAFFKLKTKARVGQGKITITASSGNFTAHEETYINVVNPNPVITRIGSFKVEPGKSHRENVIPFGIENTNKLTLEVSAIPTVNLNGRLNYLIQYPHGCLEQTLSKIFPQIHLTSLLKLNEDEKNKIESHVLAAIKKISTYQTYSGSFSYWPSGRYDGNGWINNYTGHFLLEAKLLGFYVPDALLNKWLNFQKTMANNWTTGGSESALIQSYRLYTLALARQPDLGAMNRLWETADLDSPADLHLAAAFSLVGQKKASEELLRNCDFKVGNHREHSGTFRSGIRDKALILIILSQLNKGKHINNLVNEIIDVLGSENYLNTQETSFALMALAAFYRANPGSEKYNFNLKQGENAQVAFSYDSPIFKKELESFPYPKGTLVEITNPNKVPLYVVLYNQGVPWAEEEDDSSQNLSLTVNYYDTDENSLKVEQIQQGKDFIVEVEVSNSTSRNYDNIVLNHLFPSGWQIHNPRFDGENFTNSQKDYQDFRDDRIYSYFSLPPRGKKSFRVLVNASYSGRFYLPGIVAESMYDNSIFARIKGFWVQVVK